MELLDLRGVAEFLHISVRTAQDRVRAPGFPLPVSPTGSAVKRLWYRKEVDLWLSRQRLAA